MQNLQVQTMAKISIIIPVYKVEQYLDRCVESVVKQTYENIEIILVDDGSPDNCPVLCDAWAAKDSRIKVIHKENAGVSAARNSGMEIATGEYIGFVDSDDYIEPEMFENLAAGITQSSSDLAVSGFIKYEKPVSAETEYDCTAADAQVMLFGSDYYEGYIWNKLYSAKVIKDNGIRFDTALRMCEDTLFNFDYLKCIEKVHICSYIGYYYYTRDDSVMRMKPFQNDYDMVGLIDKFISGSDSEREREQIVIWANKYWIKAIDDHIVLKNGKEYCETSIARIKENRKILLNSAIVPKVEKLFTLFLSYFKLPYIVYKKLKYIKR